MTSNLLKKLQQAKLKMSAQQQEQKADVHFLVSSGKGVVTRIPAHRSVLAAISDVFAVKFSGPFMYKKDIKVADTSVTDFKEFLKFFYQNDAVTLSMKNVAGILKLGHQYNVLKCLTECTEFLIKSLAIENVCSTLQLAITYKQAKLIQECSTFIIVNTEAVLKSGDFLKCDKDVLTHILKLNMLSCSEFQVFNACMSWVKHKSNQTELTKEIVIEHLGDSFYEIRFLSMTYEELCSLMTTYRHVLAADFRTITNMIQQPQFQPGKFNAYCRQFGWKEHAIIKCDRVTDSGFKRNFDFDDIEETSFLASKPLLLGRFKCCEISSEKVKINVKIMEIQLCGGSKAKNLLKMMVNLKSKGAILLRHPVLIRPGFFYTISIGKCSNAQVFYSNELKTQMTLDSDVYVEFHNYSTCQETGKVIGLISGLEFNRI